MCRRRGSLLRGRCGAARGKRAGCEMRAVVYIGPPMLEMSIYIQIVSCVPAEKEGGIKDHFTIGDGGKSSGGKRTFSTPGVCNSALPRVSPEALDRVLNFDCAPQIRVCSSRTPKNVFGETSRAVRRLRVFPSRKRIELRHTLSRDL